MAIKQAMILAAGLGTRLRPITDKTPKPLVPVGGKPMLDYVLALLKREHVETVAINVHHHADQMENYLASYRDAKIVLSDEREALLDSGGGLAKGLSLLSPGPTFVLNADLFWVGESADSPSNLSRLAGLFDPAKMDMAMLCVKLEDTTGHNGKLDFNLARDGALTPYQEGSPNPVVYAGAIVMNSQLLNDAPEGPFKLNLYFDRAVKNKRLYGLLLVGSWITVGSPDAIESAEKKLAEQ
jgi:MurNAc alpha-1-phosphate uridylyltransferase